MTARDDLREVVARAMYEAVNRSPTCWSRDDSGLDDEHPGTRERFERYADAALTAALPVIEAQTREACAGVALVQRCERGTPWDLACTTIAAAIRGEPT